MAVRLGIRDNPDGCLYVFGGGRGLDDCLLGRNDFTKRLPLDQLYPLGGNGLFQAGRKGEFLVFDTSRGQIFACTDFMFGLIAGRYNTRGYRDGEGPQAIFNGGGLQGHYTTARNSKGEWFIPDGGKIRKLVKGSPYWQVSTFAVGVNGSTIACDADDSIWIADFYGATLTRISPDGATRKSWPTVANVLSIYHRGQYVFCLTRYNAWDIVVRFDKTTGQLTRICGMTEQEIAAYVAQHGKQLVDGPALNGATLHSPGITYLSPDGSEIHFNGGDVCQVRRYLAATGRIDSLFVDGIWRETQIALTAPHSNTDPNLPFYTAAASGIQPDGLPMYSFPVFFRAETWRKHWGGEIYKYEVADQPAPQPGGNVLKAQFVSQSVPTTMEAGERYPVQVVMKNVGTEPWLRSSPTRLADGGSATWGPPYTNWGNVDPAAGGGRIPMPHDVQPGETVTFNFVATAPATPGTYNWRWIMHRESPKATFLDSTPTPFAIAVVEAQPEPVPEPTPEPEPQPEPEPTPEPTPEPVPVKITRGRIVMPKEITVELFNDAGEVSEKIIAAVEIEL